MPMKSLDELMTLSPSSSFCMFNYYEGNLGDQIQTLALLQHVSPRMLIMRDHLTPQKNLCLLANGWLSGGKFPSKEDYRSIKYIGVHITSELRNVETVNAMKGCGIIGCRDTATLNFLTKNNVPSYLTRCATLTFPSYYGKREGIYCVDLSNEIKEKVLKVYKDPIFATHCLEELSLDEVNDDIIMNQYRKAYSLLMQYRKAELVITSRLHVTLPCLAFGTPVIYAGISRRLDDRITALDGMGVKILNQRVLRFIPSLALRKPTKVDVSEFKKRYIEFLQRSIRNE